MWGIPLGGPPRDPPAPPRGPRVSQSSGKNCKNSQQLYKNCTYIKIPQILTLTPILGHLSNLGGPRGAKILKWPCRGVIWKIGYGSFSNFCPIFGHLTLFWWSKLKISTLVVYHTPLPPVNKVVKSKYLKGHSTHLKVYQILKP